MSRRSIVSRWRRKTAVEMMSAMAAVSLDGVFDGVQRFQTRLTILFVGLVPLRNLGIQIPTVVVEARLAGQGFNLGMGFLLQMCEADNHVGDLYSGVVDIVLNVDFVPGVAQQSNESVPENSVAQVSDVRGLIRVDAGVLDQNLAGMRFFGRLLIGGQGCRHPRAVNLYIQITRRCDLKFGDAFEASDIAANGFRDFQRRRAERLGEGKNGDGEVSEFDLRRLLNDHRRKLDAGVLLLETLPYALGKTMF